jgi:type I restriction enzyme S subunit
LPVLPGAFLIRFRLKRNQANPYFYRYYFNSPLGREAVFSVATGSVQQNVNITSLHSLLIPVPPVAEQRRIAGVLGALDDKIESEIRKRTHLDQLVRVQGTHLVRTGAEAWPSAPLSAHFSVSRGLSYSGAGLAGSSDGVPLHNLNSVLEGGGYKFAGIKYYMGDFKERHVVRPGDLVVANTEQGFDELLIAYPAIIPSYFGDRGIFSHHLHRLVPLGNSQLSRHWLYVCLLDPAIHDLVAGYANGTTVNMLPTAGLQDPVIPIPPSERLSKLDAFVAPLLTSIEQSVVQTDHLTALRDLLLPRLVSGRIRVPDSYDPDAVLGTVAEAAGAAV